MNTSRIIHFLAIAMSVVANCSIYAEGANPVLMSVLIIEDPSRGSVVGAENRPDGYRACRCDCDKYVHIKAEITPSWIPVSNLTWSSTNPDLALLPAGADAVRVSKRVPFDPSLISVELNFKGESVSDSITLEVAPFTRTDNVTGTATSPLNPYGRMWTHSSGGNLIPQTHDVSQVFSLEYAPGPDDCMDGTWSNRYLLRSAGQDLVASSDTSSIFFSGGALFAVAYIYQANGNQVYSAGTAADSRTGAGGGGTVSVQVGGLTVNVTPQFGVNAAGTISFATDIPVDINEPSPEGDPLSHDVNFRVSGSSSLTVAGACTIGNNGSGSIDWVDSRVLASHFTE